MIGVVLAAVIVLGERPGGFVLFHRKVADRWIEEKAQIIVDGDQWSAAARQVWYLHSRGAKICATKDWTMAFHRGKGWIYLSTDDFGIKRCGR